MTGRRVLVVDDEPDIRDLIAMMLETDDRCACVRTVGDLDDVVPAAMELAPDTVVLDLMFGSRTSAEVLESLRAAAPSSLIIVFTASRRAAIDAGVLDQGADLVVQKVSVSFEDLVDLVLDRAVDLTQPVSPLQPQRPV
jgi:DNA-binding NarL/FixJ family response regulator